MPLEYIHTFAAQKTFGTDNGMGYVLLPPKGYESEKDANEIVFMTSHDNPSVDDPPSWAFSIHNGNCVLSYTFAIHHYRGRTDGEVTHMLFVDPAERLLIQEGPVYAMENFTFIKTFNPIGNTLQYQDSNQIVEHTKNDAPSLKLWKDLSGDIGWCGWIIDNILKDKCIFLVYDPAQTNGSEKILSLLSELYSVFPVELRWRISFNTRVNSRNIVSHRIVGIECPAGKQPTLPPTPAGFGSVVLQLDNLRSKTCPNSMWTEYIRTGQYTLDQFQLPQSIANTERGKAPSKKLYEISEQANWCMAREKNLLVAKEDLDVLQGDVDSHKAELGRQLQYLEQNTKLLAAANDDACKEITKQQRELGEQQEQFRRELAQLQRELEESKRGIEARISESNKLLDEEIGRRTRDLGTRKAELDRRDSALEKRKTDLDQKEKECDIWEQELLKKRGELSDTIQKLSKSLEKFGKLAPSKVKPVTPKKRSPCLKKVKISIVFTSKFGPSLVRLACFAEFHFRSGRFKFSGCFSLPSPGSHWGLF